MDLQTGAAWIAAAIASVAAFVAIWQAVSASKQATYAQEQADAARVQALEAGRSADLAESQLSDLRRETQRRIRQEAFPVAEAMLKEAQDVAVEARLLASWLSGRPEANDLERLGRQQAIEAVSASKAHLNTLAKQLQPFSSEADVLRQIASLADIATNFPWYNFESVSSSVNDLPDLVARLRETAESMTTSIASASLRLDNWTKYR